ncbi:hypothetical protein MBLNU230_g0787t1 [Neophaeotheca triangularis]
MKFPPITTTTMSTMLDLSLAQPNNTSTNPILKTETADPRSRTLFIPPLNTSYSTNLWTPELHNLHDRWYVLFTADSNDDQAPPAADMYCDYACPALHHRMYVQKFGWNADGSPSFPRPGYGPFEVPSGQNASMRTIV